MLQRHRMSRRVAVTHRKSHPFCGCCELFFGDPRSPDIKTLEPCSPYQAARFGLCFNSVHPTLPGFLWFYCNLCAVQRHVFLGYNNRGCLSFLNFYSSIVAPIYRLQIHVLQTEVHAHVEICFLFSTGTHIWISSTT